MLVKWATDRQQLYSLMVSFTSIHFSEGLKVSRTVRITLGRHCASYILLKIGSGNGLPDGRHYLNQCRPIVSWTNRKKNIGEIVIELQTSSLKKMQNGSYFVRAFCVGESRLVEAPLVELLRHLCNNFEGFRRVAEPCLLSVWAWASPLR